MNVKLTNVQSVPCVHCNMGVTEKRLFATQPGRVAIYGQVSGTSDGGAEQLRKTHFSATTTMPVRKNAKPLYDLLETRCLRPVRPRRRHRTSGRRRRLLHSTLVGRLRRSWTFCVTRRSPCLWIAVWRT